MYMSDIFELTWISPQRVFKGFSKATCKTACELQVFSSFSI
jgi:hypothetical protein